MDIIIPKQLLMQNQLGEWEQGIRYSHPIYILNN